MININSDVRLEKIKGCLIGGAIGDALGYPVEFMKYESIVNKYGKSGITKYELNNDIAEISDDTQMTLFTAEGLIFGATRGSMRGIAASPESYIYLYYLKWLETQNLKSKNENNMSANSWLFNNKELHNSRAAGNTCINALMSKEPGTIKDPINDSKGCGAVMRVAPVGIYLDPKNSFEIGVKTGALTHGHPLGYLSSGILALIISKIINENNENLEDVIKESIIDIKSWNIEFNYSEEYINELETIINKAIDLSHQSIDSVSAINELGEGWVAEEALAIAIYCSLKNKSDFSQAIIDAVNHNGDSDSTGAITGNIIGALFGYKNIPNNFIEKLELRDVILEIANDLAMIVPVSEYGKNDTPEAKVWFEKYLYGTYNLVERK